MTCYQKKKKVNEEIKEVIKKYFETNENKYTHSQIYGTQQKQFLEGNLEQYRPTSRHKENLKQPNLPPKGIRKKMDK